MLTLIAQNATARGGRLLAPYAIRYIVVPRFDGVHSYLNHELALPAGLTDSLEAQLDLHPIYSPPNYLVYENVAWLPTRSMLSPAATAASSQAGAEALARTEIAGSTPVLVGARDRGPAIGPIGAGLLHVASVVDDRWQLVVDGQTISPRSAFGGTTVFEVPAAGIAHLSYTTSGTRQLSVVVQVLAWLACALLASRVDLSSLGLHRRRRVTTDRPQPLITFESADESQVITIDGELGDLR